MEPKFEYTQGNHYKWGWGNEWYGTPKPQEKFKVHLGYTTRPWGSLREEAVKAAELIASKTTKPIIVGLSGGSDSQMVCLSFKQAKIPITALICRYRYSNGIIINSHDIAVAYEFCKKHHFKYLEIDISIDDFFKTRAIELAKKYCMPKAETIIQTVAMDYAGRDYCYIMGGGDVMFNAIRNPYSDNLGLKTYDNRFSEPVYMETPVPILQHMIANEYEGTSKFWLYTPELIAAYLHDPVTQSFLTQYDIVMDAYFDQAKRHVSWKLFHWFYKPLMTYREFPEMVRVKKYTGYENLYIGANEIPSRITVYETMLKEAVAKLNPNKTVVYPIEQLIKYITTPHDETEVMVAHDSWV